MPYIYLIHTRASLNIKEPVYKIGKTADFNKRLSGYDKGNKPILVLYVNNCDIFEKLIIEIFNTNFIKRTDYGNEYFEGNVSDMIGIIMDKFNDINMCYNIKEPKQEEELKLKQELEQEQLKLKQKQELEQKQLKQKQELEQEQLKQEQTNITNNLYYNLCDDSMYNNKYYTSSKKNSLQCACKKTYAHSSSLCVHRKKCSIHLEQKNKNDNK